jgi:hypothetical protein
LLEPASDAIFVLVPGGGVSSGQERTDGTWEGWLDHPMDEHKSVLRTEQETSQPNRIAIEYWASGLEPIYLEGAFARAQGRFL